LHGSRPPATVPAAPGFGYAPVVKITSLLDGHERFRKDYFERGRELFESLASIGQHPTALFIGCCDSRVVPDLIVSAAPGDLFVLRNIANIVPRYEDGQVFNRSVGAAIEFAVHVLRVPHVIICGHTSCGGLGALLAGPDQLARDTPTLAGWLRDAASVLDRLRRHELEGEALARQLAFENVLVQLENLMTYPVVMRALEEDRLEMHGWVYDLVDGRLLVFQPETNDFRPLEAVQHAKETP
jgi:carbonic anhydrase